MLKKIKEKLDSPDIIIWSLFILFIGISLGMVNGDTDLGWQLAEGKIIFTQHRFPVAEDITWQTNLHYMFPHEWAYELLLYMFSLIPVGGLILYKGLLLMIICYLYGKIMLHGNRSYLLCILPLFPLWIASQGSTPLRPMLMSYIFILFMVYSLWFEHKYVKLYPLIGILWINFHGGDAIFLPIMCIIYLCGHLFNFRIGRITFKKLEDKEIKKIIIFGITGYACQIINPGGILAILYPYQNITDSQMINYISEWRSMTINNTVGWSMVIMVLILSFLLGTQKKSIYVSDIVLTGAFFYLAFKYVREYMLVIIAFNLIWSIYSNNLELPETTVYEEMRKNAKKNAFYIILSCIVISAMISFNYRLHSNVSGLITKDFCEIIKSYSPERLFNTYDVGGTLAQYEIPTYIDGRYVPYKDMLDKYLCLENCYTSDYVISTSKTSTYDYRGVQAAECFDYYLAEKTSRLYNQVLTEDTDRYVLIYEEGNYAFFEDTYVTGEIVTDITDWSSFENEADEESAD